MPIVRCQCVWLPNCLSAKLSLFFVGATLSALSSWFQIVRGLNFPVPSCPTIEAGPLLWLPKRPQACIWEIQPISLLFKIYLKKLSQLIPLRSMAYSTFDKVLLKRELREAAGMNALLGNRYWSNEFKAGLLICNSDIPVGEICFWFTNVLFPCYLNVEYDERISCWNPFQNHLTWSIPLNFMTSSTTSDCSQLSKSRAEYFIKEKKTEKEEMGNRGKKYWTDSNLDF